MFKTIEMKMADGSKQNFDFLAVGSTPYRYKQLFRQDLMLEITKLANSDFSAIGENADFSVSDKLAYVMNCQAEHKDMNKLNFDSFLDWVDQFETSELFNHISDIIGIYIGNKESTSEPKKEVEP